MNFKKVMSFSIGPIGASILGFITLPIITWFFSQEDIGRISMLNVAISFSTLLFSLGLDQAYVREFHETENKASLLKMVVTPGLILLLIVLLILLSSGGLISKILFDIDSRFISLFVALVILAAFISRFLSLILRMKEKGLAYSMSQLLPKLILIVILVCCILFFTELTFEHLLLANVTCMLSVCVIFSWNTRKEWCDSFKYKIDFFYLKKMLQFGIPLIFGGVAFWGLTTADKILINKLSNFEELGLYSVSVSFSAIATIFQRIFTTIWMPTVYRLTAEGGGEEYTQRMIRYVLLVVIILFCITGLFSWIISFILPENYESVKWIIISCLGFPLLYTLSETTVIGLGVTRRSGLAMLAALISFFVNLIGNVWLIPIYGAAGAASSTCFSFWIFFILRTEFSIYVWKSIPRLSLYTYTSILVVGSIFNTLYGEKFKFELMIFWLLMLISIVFFFNVEIMKIKKLIFIKFGTFKSQL